jgi:transposase
MPIRKRILELYERGRSTREIAHFSGFCIAAVRRVRQQFRERRTLEPRTYLCGRKTLLTEERKQRLRHLLSEQADSTLAELGAGLDRPFCTSTIDLWLRRLGWRFKKLWPPPNKSLPTWPKKGPAGMRSWRPSPRPVWCLWTKAEPIPRGRACGAGRWVGKDFERASGTDTIRRAR